MLSTKVGGVNDVGAWVVGRIVQLGSPNERRRPDSPPFHGSPALRAGLVCGSGVGTSFPAALPSQIRTHEPHSGATVGAIVGVAVNPTESRREVGVTLEAVAPATVRSEQHHVDTTSANADRGRW